MNPHATILIGANARAPSPDFSSLSPDELNHLEVVLRKQVLIEHEQNQCLSGLRRTMVHLERTIEHDRVQQKQRKVSL
ncbi:unnamed protein product, partial [Rotaria magnacalcarata]